MDTKDGNLKNSIFYGGVPPHQAVARADAEALRMLLRDRPSDVDTKGAGGATPLHIAALHDASQHLAEILLVCGASPSPYDDFGFTPLHRMVQHDRIHGVTSLLHRGVPVDQPVRSTSETALHLAVKLKRVDIAVVLLAFGANKNACDKDGVRPADLAEFAEVVFPGLERFH